MDFDYEEYCVQLAFARMNLAAIFDESKHPRLTSGRFRRLFHASDKEYQPGDILVPASKSGHQSRFQYADAYEPDKVYLFDARNGESAQQEFGQHVYEVVAGGQVNPDNEQFLPEYEEHGMGKDSWTTSRAKVLRKLTPEEVERLRRGKLRNKTYG